MRNPNALPAEASLNFQTPRGWDLIETSVEDDDLTEESPEYWDRVETALNRF